MVYVRRLHGFCLSVMKQLHQLHVKGVFAQHGRCCNVNFIQHRDQDFFLKKNVCFSVLKQTESGLKHDGLKDDVHFPILLPPPE